MNDERVEEVVTKFVIDTCSLRPQLNLPAVEAALHCVQIVQIMAYQPDCSHPEAGGIPLTTGSVAEFYIEPMLPHIGDVDVMFHHSDQLAIPQGHPPPTQLPAEFHNYVQVWEIIDSDFPGYVYLKRRYLLTECNEDDMYKLSLIHI